MTRPKGCTFKPKSVTFYPVNCPSTCTLNYKEFCFLVWNSYLFIGWELLRLSYITGNFLKFFLKKKKNWKNCNISTIQQPYFWTCTFSLWHIIQKMYYFFFLHLISYANKNSLTVILTWFSKTELRINSG